jgi:fido (protein-threonine AMPylation protein)
MSRVTPYGVLDAVLAAVRRLPAGATVAEIAAGLPAALPRRTLQRYLAVLVAEQRLVSEGAARATRYRIPHVSVGYAPAAAPVFLVAEESYPELSAEAVAVRDLVRQPLSARKPVGYVRAFLQAYRPGETWYLPGETRRRLAAMGASDGSERAAGTYARQIYNRLLIDLSFNSSRLEGNTYSLLETERLLAAGAAAEGKDVHETQMILNHKAAIELLVEQAGEIGFNRYTLLNLHALLAENLLHNPHAAGRLRLIPVGIGGTAFRPPAVPQQIAECFDEILTKAEAIADPFEQAFFAMVHLPYLQPFEDVNKRVSRLAANIPLVRGNLSPLSFVDVPDRAYIDGLLGVYELNRIELLRDVFVWAYERSCARYANVRQTLGQPDLFRMRYREALKQTVADIVRAAGGKPAATAAARAAAEVRAAGPDRLRFVDVVEEELLTLHEGNIARYRLRPSEYERWKLTWH